MRVVESQSRRVVEKARTRSLRLYDSTTLRLLLALLAAFPALANITTASITGRVLIEGKLAPGVTVTASSTALQEPRVTVTNARGRYWLGALPPGEYDVTFSLEGHTTLTRRATLELARVARADATLEPNPDEDSVTSTTKTVSVADTLPLTSHFDDRALDRLPTGRLGSAALAPGGFYATIDLVDGVPSGAIPSEETVQQITVIREAAPVEWESLAGSATPILTRSGGEDFFFTLRDTITSGAWSDVDPDDSDPMHFGEATLGGRIVPQRLWFFAAAWRGEQAFPNALGFEGSVAKADLQLGRSHHLDLSYSDTRQRFGITPFDIDSASVRYTAVAGARLTSEVIASRTTTSDDMTIDFLSGRASWTAGDHVLTAGFSNAEGDGPDYRSFYASDRWAFSRFNVYAGVRYDDATTFGDRITPRIAASYDMRGDGTRAIHASWGEYAWAPQPATAIRIMSLGYATAIGNSGSARIDAIRRETGSFWQNELQFDARYRLFDRIEAGAAYTLANRYDSGLVQLFFPEQVANVWLGAELPVGNHEFGATLLQRYVEGSGGSVAPTDVALRYTIPLTRLGILLAADATNVFAVGDDPYASSPRALRLWIRLRV